MVSSLRRRALVAALLAVSLSASSGPSARADFSRTDGDGVVHRLDMARTVSRSDRAALRGVSTRLLRVGLTFHGSVSWNKQPSVHVWFDSRGVPAIDFDLWLYN